jgi:hypothetical protein
MLWGTTPVVIDWLIIAVIGTFITLAPSFIVYTILERSVYKQLVECLQENKMLYHLQSGFRQKYSTDTCLIYLLDYLRTDNAKGIALSSAYNISLQSPSILIDISLT